jgi:hypothetical protein
MESFTELATRYRRVAVHGLETGADLSGTLELAGDETMAHLSSKQEIGSEGNEKGWFDLNVVGPSGIRILLHNALLRSQTDHGLSNGFTSARTSYAIFPNLVVFDTGGVTTDGKVRAISFTADGFEAFFAYGALERLYLEPGDDQLKALLKAKRRLLRKTDLFNPHEIHLRHGYGAPVKFRRDDARYDVQMSSRASWRGNQERFELIATATIQFDTLIDIDLAIERVWEWGWFFGQLAFNPLPLTALGVPGSLRKPGRSADFYLPSMADRDKLRCPNWQTVSVPFCRWRERGQLQAAMQGWFAHCRSRETFRGLVANVLNSARQRIDVRHIISLCAAIESLDELTGPSPLRRNDIKAMVRAAQSAAIESGSSVDPARIASALAMLVRPSLKHRLEQLGAAVPFIAADDLKLLFLKVQNLRNGSAHGQAYALMESGLIAPTTIALTALCVLYDLTTSGIPVTFRDRSQLEANVEFIAAMAALRSNGRWA